MRVEVSIGAARVPIGAVGSAAAFPWLTSVGSLRAVARAGATGSSETSQLGVEIDNTGRQASRVLGQPLRRLADVYDDDDRLFFRGTVQRVDVGRVMRLTLESGGAGLLLSEPLPMRTTRDLGDFSEDVALPLRFGDLSARRFRLIRLDGSTYLAAGHAMAGIAQVFVDAERTLAYQTDLLRDALGNVSQVVRFGAEIGEDQIASATGYGMLDARTGALVENPADLMEYVLALAGVSALFPQLRAEAAAEGLRLAGSITQARSVRAIVDEIAGSAGAIWTPEFARLYPVATIAGPVHDLDASAAGGMDDPYADRDDSADVLRVGYDLSEAADRAQHHVELSAAPRRFGGLASEIELPWLWLPANAESVGRRILARKAGRRFRVDRIGVDRHDLRPGHAVRLVDLPEWGVDDTSPVVMLTQVEIDGDAGGSRLSGETVLSSPRVDVTAHSLALPDTTEGGVDIEFRNGIATFTALDDDGRPLYGARMSVDGGAPLTVDAKGQARFAVSSGQHELVIERDGYGTIRSTFTVP